MNKHKHFGLCKLMALVLALVLVAGMIPVTARAGQTPQIIVEQGYAMPGATVELDVVLQNNTGISNALLELNFDDSLELIKVERGDALTYLFFTEPGVYTSPCNFLWDSLAGEDTEDGTLMTLTFRVKENAQVGKDAHVWLRTRRTDITNAQDKPVEVTLVDGLVEIIDYMPGDVNGDRLINGTDVSMLRRYIVADPVTINTLAADVNGDSRINGTDVVLLRRAITGGYYVEFKTGRPPCTHSAMTAVEAKAATCLDSGCIAHWHCADCGKYYADAAGKQQISTEDALIAAFGHTVVVDAAVAPTHDTLGFTEGSHCSVCNEVLTQQQPIDKLEPNYHAITYMELHGAESPQPNRYAEHAGLLDLPVPERPGYEFVGWFTASDGGDVVDYIPKGSTEDYVLFAAWEKETYSIYYFEAPENENVDSYTVDDRIVLAEPRWSGLKFSHWTDQYGNIVKEIPKGSSGDLELTAHWTRLRNIPYEGNTKGLMMTYDPQLGRYYFIYELGIIEHVVLEEVSLGSANLKFNSGATDLTFTLEESVTVSDSIAKSIATTVSESVSKSTGWENSYEWGGESSNSHEVSVSASAEFGIGAVNTTIEAEYGYNNTNTESWGKSESQGGSTGTGSETSYSSASTVAFMKEISSTVTTSFTISKDMPEGYYSYVHAGNVRVFGVVTYDPAEDTFFLDTYSVVDNMHEMMLYYRDVNELNDQTVAPLNYDIPRERILEIIDNSYFIAYDGNTNDSGNMLMTVQGCDETVILPENTYGKTGYTFQEWITEDGETRFRDGAQVTGLGQLGEIVTLTAHWTPNTYTVNYNANVPENASVTAENIPASTACVYDTAVTLGAAPTMTGWAFAGWYRDPECTVKLGDGGESVESANFTADPNGVVEAYAKWGPNEIQITLDGNGGQIGENDTETRTMRFNDEYGQLPTPTRGEYAFLGWYLGDMKITPFTRIETSEAHTLTAMWIRVSQTRKTSKSYGYWDPDEYESPDYRAAVTDDDGVFEHAGGQLDKAALKAAGYTSVTVTVGFDAYQKDADYIDVWVCNHNKTNLANKEFTVKRDGEYHWNEWTYTFSIDILDENCNFYIEFGSNGKGSDNWLLGNINISIEAVKG